MLNNLLPICTEFHSSLSQTPAVEKGLCICCNSLPGNHLRLGTPRRFLEQKKACRYELFNFPVCAFPCCSGSVHNKLWHSHTDLLLLVHQPQCWRCMSWLPDSLLKTAMKRTCLRCPVALWLNKAANDQGWILFAGRCWKIKMLFKHIYWKKGRIQIQQ